VTGGDHIGVSSSLCPVLPVKKAASSIGYSRDRDL
jgi:hypothetical protein